MFDFLTHLGKNKELEALMQEIDSNLANNYKDAAQEALARFEQKMCDLTAQGSLKPKSQKEYANKLVDYKQTLKGFSHKDQKPYWESNS